jgi:schlafen family protein
MVNEQTLRDLLALRSESKNLDHKQSMNWTSATNEQKYELTKDILAMMNTRDGGRIVVGVEDAKYVPVGVSDDDQKSFDPTTLNDFVHKYTDPAASCQVQKLRVEGKNFVVIDVPEFADVPIICKANAHSSSTNKLILQGGGLYMRTEKATSELISSAEEMRDLMSRAMLKRGDHLLRTIEALIKGRPSSSATDMDLYKEELEEAEAFFLKVLSKDVLDRGYWELTALPIGYVKERVASLGELGRALGDSEVSMRGWNFPHTDREGAYNFSCGRQSSTIWNRYKEAYRAYLSGLFMWRSAFWEDSPEFGSFGPPGSILSFVNIIFQITEFFVFISRYYAKIAESASVSVIVRLTKTSGRHLVSMGPMHGELHGEYVCKLDEIKISGDYSVSRLRASYEEIARYVIRRVFEIFQWTSVTDEIIQQRQRQLIERRL